jgi:hypothetical protein
MVTLFIWLRIRDLAAGSCEQGNKLLGPTKCWEFLEWLLKERQLQGRREGINEL